MNELGFTLSELNLVWPDYTMRSLNEWLYGQTTAQVNGEETVLFCDVKNFCSLYALEYPKPPHFKKPDIMRQDAYEKINKFIDIFTSQKTKYIDLGWPKLTVITKIDGLFFKVCIPTNDVNFYFEILSGDFIGIVNYKE